MRSFHFDRFDDQIKSMNFGKNLFCIYLVFLLFVKNNNNRWVQKFELKCFARFLLNKPANESSNQLFRLKVEIKYSDDDFLSLGIFLRLFSNTNWFKVVNAKRFFIFQMGSPKFGWLCSSRVTFRSPKKWFNKPTFTGV